MASIIPPTVTETRTVLLIEDNPGDLRLIEEMLKDGGGRFRFECESRLAAGLGRLARGGVAVILLDLSLPESQGLDTLLHVRVHSPRVPVVVLTGSDDEELGNRAVHAGAQDYLIKGKVDGPLLSRALRYAIERSRIEEELRLRVEQLAEQDRRKDEFLAVLAHELRNPLAPLLNGLEVMRLTGGLPETVARARDLMDRQLSHMVRLVDDLLDVSRISRGKMELRRSRVRLGDVVGSAIETARPLIDAAGHELTIDLPGEPVILDADLTRLAQVFANLLTNSAKYTERGGKIWLTAAREGSEVIVAVRDTGIGIPTDALPRIFDIFSQVDRSLEKSTGGLGIGLSLVKGLVEMHGGTVAAKSEGAGRGSTFTVRLPIAAASPELPQTTAAISCDAGVATRRVLVVDDNRDGAESLAEMLQLLGHEAYTAHDGLGALEAADRLRPDLILMDVGMPRLNGLDATRRIREQPWGRGVTIIALTGWGQEADRERSRDAGCEGHLVKPIGIADLERLLAGLAGRK